MKSLTFLWRAILDEMGIWCTTSTTRDWKTATRRFKDEGSSFFTMTLPNFGKEFEKALDQGFVGDDQFSGFRKTGGLPCFLKGFLHLIFDPSTRMILDQPNIDAIFAVRQLTSAFNKLLLPVNQQREAAAMKRFVECEQEVQETIERLIRDESDELFLSKFERISFLLWADVLTVLNGAVYDGDILPKHGPGSTADRLLGNQKYIQTEWTRRLNEVFPIWEHLVANWGHNYVLDHVELLEPEDERPVRVISVPKTMKTPRIIAIEPTCMQYMQQGIADKLVPLLEARRPFVDEQPAFGMIGFTDQVPNQRMARFGSLSGELATLDLSEASDRVSNLLVETMLRRFSHVAEGVEACRSRTADVQGHGIIPLTKFASMGSGLCFPIEAMVFLTIVFIGIEYDQDRPLTRRDIFRYRELVRVYGDDIIVPVDNVDSVIYYLEAFGLKVNVNKSFWTGKFRESCGKDYYDGQDVTPVKVRRVLPSSRKDAPEIASLVGTRNLFYKRGMWRTAKHLDTVIRKFIPFPCVGEESPILGRFSYLGFESTKEDSLLHRPLVKGALLKSRAPVNSIDGHAALLKYFLRAERGEYTPMDLLYPAMLDAEHLERSGRPDSVYIKIGWASSV